jgi:hypothetical protein
MTKDVEMAARNGNGNGAVAGEPYYPPPGQGGDAEVDDDGKHRRTGKQNNKFTHLMQSCSANCLFELASPQNCTRQITRPV